MYFILLQGFLSELDIIKITLNLVTLDNFFGDVCLVMNSGIIIKINTFQFKIFTLFISFMFMSTVLCLRICLEYGYVGTPK